MPQLYPMMWTILTILMLLFSTGLTTSIFFFKPNFFLFSSKKNIKTNFLSFKW
uniref:ATP synthase F0 subunit 8 n=1 Tax=Amblyomma patinoi TaxID=1408821 RepID=UPI0023F22F16|nr:ATP synthase F0 subunit 8 [Amblyomma patinoi]WEF75004.1 ATP synthase F0 subunit 8 [Amblyomma patinoi]